MSFDTWVLLNVAFQILNLVIFFFIFKILFWDKIISSLNERRDLLNKIKNAEEEYDNIISSAKSESDRIIKEWLSHKESILSEAEELAKMEKSKIIDQANNKAKEIIDSAIQKAEWIQKQLEENWENSVKNTTKVVLNKIFEDNVEFQEDYLNKLVSNFK